MPSRHRLGAAALACGLVLGASLAPPAAADSPPLLRVTSPDQRLAIELLAGRDGTLLYRARRNGRLVLLPAPLGLKLEGSDLSRGLRLAERSAVHSITERYALAVSKRRQHLHRAREASAQFTNARQHRLTVTLRAANDGVAWRLAAEVPGQARLALAEEIGGFRFAAGTRAWLQPMQVAKTGFEASNPAYEEHYRIDVPVGTPSPLPAGWVFPALFRSGPDWVAVSESGLDGSWHASRLAADSSEGTTGGGHHGAHRGAHYRLAPPDAREVMAHGAQAAGVAGLSDALLAEGGPRLASPWRFAAIGALRTVMDSTLGTDLAPPPAVGFDAARVQPGHAAWSWALLKDDSAVEPVQRQFIDYAARMGWNYLLIDAGWDVKIGRERMRSLVADAAAQGVGILLWYNSAGPWNTTPLTPRNRMHDPATRRAEFAWLREIGAKGVKVDFFGGDGVSVIRYYLDILRDAAEFGLLVNFHGSTLPRGWQRTWPNLMTMEGVKGFEFTTFTQADQDAVPAHAAMLPFTRNLFDPMDFTPMVFGDIPNIRRVTRNGFELAQAVLFTSGIQHYAEVPEGMATVPGHVHDTLRQLPRQWDETRFVAGTPGRQVVVARRAGSRWYVAGLNADEAPVRLTLDLGFVAGAAGRHGRLTTDGATPRALVQRPLRAGRQVALTLAPRGGFLAEFGVTGGAR